MKFQFKIEHIALQPRDPARAKALMVDLGLTEWCSDTLTSFGQTWGSDNHIAKTGLEFNYQADCDRTFPDGRRRPIELEIMTGCGGVNWMDDWVERQKDFVSHFGMQVDFDQLEQVRSIMSDHKVRVAQEVVTLDHANEHVRTSRRYKKVIFDTRSILGVDLEFNVLLQLGE